MPASYRDEYEILQGRIRLYRRTFQGTNYQSDNWYATYRIPGIKNFSRSLNTLDQLEAEKIAEREYFNFSQRADAGLSISKTRFSNAATSFLKDFEANVIREANLPRHLQEYRNDRLLNNKLIVNKFLIPFFAEKHIQDISDFDVESYKNWRKTYWISGTGSEIDEIVYTRDGRRIKRPKRKAELAQPSYGTVNKELTVLRKIFEFARMNKLIENREIPKITNLPKPKNYVQRKPGLTNDEIETLLINLAERHESEINPKHKGYIFLLIHYIAFMCSTGIRVSEAKGIRFADCVTFEVDEETFLKIFVRAKGKSRELVSLSGTGKILEMLKIRHEKNAKANNWNFSQDTLLFVNPYGKPVNSFAKGLNRALEDAGLLNDIHGKKRTAGAFRKYYITAALLNNIHHLKLAKQCGTSVSIIEQYYNEIETHHTPRDYTFPNIVSIIQGS